MTNEPTLLMVLDGVLMGAGAIVMIVAARRWRRRGGGDPLAGSPIRANRLHPIMVLACLAAYLLSMLGGLEVGRSLIPAGMSAKAAEAWTGVIASAVTQTVGITTCLVVAVAGFRTGLRGFGLAAPRTIGRGGAVQWVLGGWLAGLCCTGLVAWLVQWLIRLVWSGYQPPEHGVFMMLRSGEATAAMRFLAIFGAAVMAPISEEFLFRGILQTALRRALPPRRSMYHRWFAIVMTAAIFGMMHSSTPQFIPALVLLGVIFGYLYERTGSLIVVIAIHMLFNIKSLAWYHLQAWLA